MASKRAARFIFPPVRLSCPCPSPSTLRPYPRLPRTVQPAYYLSSSASHLSPTSAVPRRFAHSIPKPRPSNAPAPSPTDSEVAARKKIEPHYQLTFTCVPCGDRSSHTISKQGYHHGSVLITCPSCRNRHIISDHLSIFGDRKITVEELMREKGQLVKRGTLGEDGDVEFWEDNAIDEADAELKRETRDPSSTAAQPSPAPPSPVGGRDTRPTLDGAAHYSNAVPSTKRQYSTREPSRPVSFRHVAELRQALIEDLEPSEPPSRNTGAGIQKQSIDESKDGDHSFDKMSFMIPADRLVPFNPPRTLKKRANKPIGIAVSEAEKEAEIARTLSKAWIPQETERTRGVTPLGFILPQQSTQVEESQGLGEAKEARPLDSATPEVDAKSLDNEVCPPGGAEPASRLPEISADSTGTEGQQAQEEKPNDPQRPLVRRVSSKRRKPRGTTRSPSHEGPSKPVDGTNAQATVRETTSSISMQQLIERASSASGSGGDGGGNTKV